ncbi:MAG: ComEC/Rec2 family competence protein [Verrucomicrobiota bacterium]
MIGRRESCAGADQRDFACPEPCRLHIALIAGILVSVLRVLRVPRAAAGFIVIPLIWFYTAATGWQASAIRSTIMMTVVIAGWALERPSDLINSLAATGLIILIWQPTQLFQASFQLSFFVVLSIALIVPPLEKVRQKLLAPDPLLPPELRPRWKRWLDWPIRVVTTSLATSVAAWLGSMPLLNWRRTAFLTSGQAARIAFTSAAVALSVGTMAAGPHSPRDEMVPTSTKTHVGDAAFHTTHWSAVLTARGDDSTAAHEALSHLCQTYWYPLYAYVRRRGNPPEEAADLTQAFFAQLLAKNYLDDLTLGVGRFRSFLLASLKHFLANEWDKARTQKRGGGRPIISLDDDTAEERFQLEPVDNVTPETIFERRWACTVLEKVLERLRNEFVASERAELFDELKSVLSADQEQISYAEIGRRTGLKEATVKVAVHRLRRRYGELLRAQIAQTVKDAAEVEDEVRHLIAVMSV